MICWVLLKYAVKYVVAIMLLNNSFVEFIFLWNKECNKEPCNCEGIKGALGSQGPPGMHGQEGLPGDTGFDGEFCITYFIIIDVFHSLEVKNVIDLFI